MRRPIDSADYVDKLWIQNSVRDNPNCHYCEVTLIYGRGVNRKTHPYGLQFDRMDSSLPHIKSNCVQCCNTYSKQFTNKPYMENIVIVIKNFLQEFSIIKKRHERRGQGIGTVQGYQ